MIFAGEPIPLLREDRQFDAVKPPWAGVITSLPLPLSQSALEALSESAAGNMLIHKKFCKLNLSTYGHLSPLHLHNQLILLE